MPWNRIESPTTPATRMVAKADSPPALPPPMPWPIFGNTYKKTNTSRKGWMIVRGMNSLRFFLSTVRSRSSSAPKAERLALAADLPISAPSSTGAVTVAISRAGPCR